MSYSLASFPTRTLFTVMLHYIRATQTLAIETAAERHKVIIRIPINTERFVCDMVC
jgi:hypothetical protein